MINNNAAAVGDLQRLVRCLCKIQLAVIFHTRTKLRFCWLGCLRPLCQSFNILIFLFVSHNEIPVIVLLLQSFQALNHSRCTLRRLHADNFDFADQAVRQGGFPLVKNGLRHLLNNLAGIVGADLFQRPVFLHSLFALGADKQNIKPLGLLRFIVQADNNHYIFWHTVTPF